MDDGTGVRFEVLVNGEHFRTVGVGRRGVLTAIVTWVHREGEARAELTLDLGRIDSAEGSDLAWPGRNLAVGDEVRLRVLPPETGA